jgi:hypothetical protein
LGRTVSDRRFAPQWPHWIEKIRIGAANNAPSINEGEYQCVTNGLFAPALLQQ